MPRHASVAPLPDSRISNFVRFDANPIQYHHVRLEIVSLGEAFSFLFFARETVPTKQISIYR